MKETIEQLAKNPEFGSQFHVPPRFWEKNSEIIDVLQIPFNATKAMQGKGYGLSDFYISWLRMKRSLGRITNGQLNLADKLMEKLEEREITLMETPTMITAMYLDPRIKHRLSRETNSKELAKISVEKIHLRMRNVDKNSNDVNAPANDTLDELNAEAMDNVSNQIPTTILAERESNIHLSLIRESMTKFDTVNPTDIKSNIFDFWKERKAEFPLLYDVACIVHAVPAGQCSVERDFSSFTCVRESRRCKLLPKNMTNILMIRLNQDVHEEWKATRILEIQEGAEI